MKYLRCLGKKALSVALLLFLSWGLSACSSLQVANFKGPGPLDSHQGRDAYSPYASQDLQLNWPVDDIRINQHFEPRRNRRHQGMDLGGVRETPIRAAHDGVVVYTGQKFRGY